MSCGLPKKGVVSLIYTLNARNTIPLCKCPCYREFRKETDQKEKVINDSADFMKVILSLKNIIIVTGQT